MKTLFRLAVMALFVARFGLFERVSAETILYSDDFEVDSSASWNISNGSGTGTPDYTAQFAFNYLTNKFVRNGVTNTIPLAPSGTGGKGVKLTVNKNDVVADTSAVTISPAGQVFSGNYTLKFDLWINYAGGVQGAGGVGTTEFAQFGINTSGTHVNWDDPNAISDGVWFAVTGEAGAAGDWRAYVGDNSSPRIVLPTIDAGFPDRNFDGLITSADQEVFAEANTNLFKLMFPKPAYETEGMPGKQWVQGEIRQRTNSDGSHTVSWLINGYVIAAHSFGDSLGQTIGDIMLGTMDIFSSISNPKEDNFVIYDNVRVVDLSTTDLLPVVEVVADDPTAAEPGGSTGLGTDTGTFTISRTGSTIAPLTVNYRMANAGTASNGVDYVLLNGVAIIPAGASSTNITLTVTNDAISETAEFAIMMLVGSTNYDIYTNASATVTVLDDGDLPVVTLLTTKTNAYELNPNNSAKFNLRLSNTNSTDVNVSLSLSGTATNGSDYTTIPGSITIPAGQTNVLIEVRPINNNRVDGNRTVILSVISGSGYFLGATTNGTATIHDDDLPTSTGTLYSQNFDSGDDSANWNINPSPAPNVTDTSANFFFDYSTIGIPPAPNSAGTTRGLKLQANLTAGVLGGLSVSPKNQNFTGDYRVRFDLWQNFNGPLNLSPAPSGSTEMAGYGLGTGGTNAQWLGSVQKSIHFGVTPDGDNTVDFRAFSSATTVTTGYADASGVYAAGTVLAPRDCANPYYSDFGGYAAPSGQISLYPQQTNATLAGVIGFAWRDVVITKQGANVTWSIDGRLIATVSTNGLTMDGNNILFNFSDTNAGKSTDVNAPALAFGLIDNIRVENLTVSLPTITGTRIINGGTQVQIDFASATGSAFTLLSSATVDGTYSLTTATFSNTGTGTYRFETAVNGAQRFFRIQSN